MDFSFSDDERRFDAQVVEFLSIERNHPDSEVFFAGKLDGHSQQATTPEHKSFMRRMAAKGWLGMSWPVEYGGDGHEGLFEYLLNERLAAAGGPLIGKGVGIIGKTLIHHGSDDLKQRFLPKIRAGEIDFALGYSEPEAGSDLASLKLRAERIEGGWKLNGQKRFSSSAHFADWYWVAARTDPEAAKHKGITLFLIDLKDPCLTVLPQATMGGMRTNEVFFDDVIVPDSDVVGEINEGWGYVCEALDYERFTIYTVGSLEAKFERVMAWARTREPGEFGSNDGNEIRRGIVGLATELEVARLLTLRVVDRAAKGEVPSNEASMCKLVITQLHQKMTEWMLDHVGPAGILGEDQTDAIEDGFWERSWRANMVQTIGGGSTEIQRNILARRALGLPSS